MNTLYCWTNSYDLAVFHQSEYSYFDDLANELWQGTRMRPTYPACINLNLLYLLYKGE